jgi:hypothetical protein
VYGSVKFFLPCVKPCTVGLGWIAVSQVLHWNHIILNCFDIEFSLVFIQWVTYWLSCLVFWVFWTHHVFVHKCTPVPCLCPFVMCVFALTPLTDLYCLIFWFKTLSLVQYHSFLFSFMSDLRLFDLCPLIKEHEYGVKQGIVYVCMYKNVMYF